MSCTEPDFWNQRYRANRTPWDQGMVPEATLAYLRRSVCPGGAVLIPGCGSGYEVRAFHDAGWQVRAIDFSAAAVERARAGLGPLAPAVSQADFFRDDLGGPFDVVYERTFLCALPPDRWADYVERMNTLVKPGGCLAGLFAYGEELEPPPFLLPTFSTGTALFAGGFVLVEDHAIPPEHSIPVFQGKERWQVWKRRLASATAPASDPSRATVRTPTPPTPPLDSAASGGPKSRNRRR